VPEAETWIFNASPLIALAKVDCLHLPEKLASEIIVPEAVRREILLGPAEDPARLALEEGWGLEASVASIPEGILEWGLGAGESAVLAASTQQRDAVAILDDDTARRCARALQVPVMGTLGIIIRAKVQGLIPSASALVRELQRAGLYLDLRTSRKALQGVEESWKLQ
jgi:predicted nucleic acid-binding protein